MSSDDGGGTNRQRWFPLESNPALINSYIEKLGFDTSLYEFVDVFSTEDWALDMVAQPVAAVLMLYPLTEKQTGKGDGGCYDDDDVIAVDEMKDRVWFTKQRIGNACGTIGLLHSLLNLPEGLRGAAFREGSWLERFADAAPIPLDPYVKAGILETDPSIAGLHDEATASDANATDRGSLDDDVITHFVALVCVGGVLYELDGRKEGPVVHGPTTQDALLLDACAVVRTYMARDPTELRFTITALAPRQSLLLFRDFSLSKSTTTTTPSGGAATMKLRAVGFCGADDSVHPHQLVLYGHQYPFVEFGVLFRPDREGTPRYASPGWVEELARAVAVRNKSAVGAGPMRLAAHLCERRVNQVLSGDDSFVAELEGWGFQRVQINATEVNGVDTSRLGESVLPFLSGVVARHPELEFILQRNDETRPLWEGILHLDDEPLAGRAGRLPPNVSMLLDESKGTGVLAQTWPVPPPEYEIGYAGGIGPDNIRTVLGKLRDAAAGREVWIDMESQLRSEKNGRDVFDLDKCYQVILAVCESGAHSHPSFLPNNDV